jgi:DNA mismatch repair protein MutS
VAEAPRLRTAASAVADADALLSLARVASERGYARPTLDRSEALEIAEGRHPVVEAMLPPDSGGFVPNDLSVASSAELAPVPPGPEPDRVAGAAAGRSPSASLRVEAQILVITGPNMAGKSTAMRQAALIALMAQMGSFVPARRARVGLVDRIFTRVGATDDLARGRSTFMVEMTEAAAILHNATRRSLVVLDEIGRGTSTFDGLSIAWAVAEHLHDRVGCRTLFATHYHELQDLARERPRVRNLTVAVREVGEKVVFLRKLVAGGASRSYGIEVAKLAGLPAEVLARAREILRNLESLEVDEGGHATLARGGQRRGPPPAQLGLFAAPDPALAKLDAELRGLDVDGLRPIEALQLLAEWKRRLYPPHLALSATSAGPLPFSLWQPAQRAWAFSWVSSILAGVPAPWQFLHPWLWCSLWLNSTLPGLAGSVTLAGGGAAKAQLEVTRSAAAAMVERMFFKRLAPEKGADQPARVGRRMYPGLGRTGREKLQRSSLPDPDQSRAAAA